MEQIIVHGGNTKLEGTVKIEGAKNAVLPILAATLLAEEGVTTLKNVPNGYDKEHSQAEFLKMKSWYLEHPLSDEEICDSEKLFLQAVKMFQMMKPFNDYLNKALIEFEMPKR